MQFMRDGPYFFKKINIRSPGGEPTTVLQYQPPLSKFQESRNGNNHWSGEATYGWRCIFSSKHGHIHPNMYFRLSFMIWWDVYDNFIYGKMVDFLFIDVHISYGQRLS